MLSKPIHLSETVASEITCVGVKSADLHLQFATEKKTMVSTNEKVRNYIPDDISLSILSKLPLKSLKRFECVRKSWSLLIDNSHFMNMFRNNFLSNLRCSYYDGSSILLQIDKPNFKDDFYSLSGERFENKVKLDFSNPYENQFNFKIFGVGSVNGILCLHEYDALGEIILLNPATQAFKVLPPSQVESVELSIPDDAKDFVDFYIVSNLHGFGYDRVINDYKIIRYVRFDIESSVEGYEDLEEIIYSNSLGQISLEPLWEIYSLTSNSWRKLDVDMPFSKCNEGTQVYMDGICHWLCEKDEEDNPAGPCLVSFYLNNEVFLITPIPSNSYDCFEVEASWTNLARLNECVALISYHEPKTTFHISILGEIGKKESWTNLFTIGPFSCVECPIGVGAKGELFFQRKDEELAWFDLNTQMIEELGYKAGYCRTRIIIYKENILANGGIGN